MGWLDDLRDWLKSHGGGSPAPPKPDLPAPIFTMGPQAFGVAHRVAGVEWRTDQRTSGTVRYSVQGTPEPHGVVIDDSRQQDHQRTLSNLEPGTTYDVMVRATNSANKSSEAACTITTLASEPGPTPPGPEAPPPELPPGTQPIPHEARTVNVLAESMTPWLPGSLIHINPTWQDWLLRYCAGGETFLIIADLDFVPGQMRRAGYVGRDNALYYVLSRSYAEWPWQPTPGDPDAHLSDQRDQIHDFWAKYLDVILAAMRLAASTRARFLENDGPDRCGDVLSEYSLRQLAPVSDRIDRGEVYHD